jgi:hypothetical protein
LPKSSKKEVAMKKKILISLFEKIGLSTEAINKISVQTGFIKRSRKIKAVEFFIYMITESVRGCVSCNDLATAIQFEAGTMASRQAYHAKMNCASVRFFEAILAILMHAKTDMALPSQFHQFKRILVQDSTLIKLPEKLMDIFSGVKNAYTQVCNARIQCVYDLLSGSFTHWSIHSYSRNDLAVANTLKVRSGDLVLRDRGYFTPNESRRIIEAKGEFVSRYKCKTILGDPKTGQEIDLIWLLKTQRNIDRKVLVGKDSQLEVRIIATEVSQETANRRRQKAKKENKGHHPSKEILFLMGWTIFLTSLTSHDLDINDFLELYGLRWRIENVFKTWKSHFNFDKIHAVGENQLRLILMARFIAVTLFHEKIYLPLSRTVAKKSDKELSLMKLMRYISRHFRAIPQLLKAARGSIKNLKIVKKYCTYDKRKRPNYAEKERDILTVIDTIQTLS